MIDANNTLIAGTFDNVDLRVENRFDELDDRVHASTRPEPRTPVHRRHARSSCLLGHSQLRPPTTRSRPRCPFDQFNVQGYSYDYREGHVPLINYGSAALTDPQQMGPDPDRACARRPRSTPMTPPRLDGEYGLTGRPSSSAAAGPTSSTSSTPPSCAARTAPAPTWSRPCPPPCRPSRLGSRR